MKDVPFTYAGRTFIAQPDVGQDGCYLWLTKGTSTDVEDGKRVKKKRHETPKAALMRTADELLADDHSRNRVTQWEVAAEELAAGA